MPTTSDRKHRFERTSDPVAFQLTDRDLQIIRAVASNRLMTSRQIQALVPGSFQNLIRRLNGLYHSGYLDRPRAQLDYYSKTGSSPIVYALADKGARLLNARDGGEIREKDWKAKNEVGKLFIQHTTAVADMHVTLMCSTRARPDVEFITSAELIAAFPRPPVSPDKAFLWKTSVRHNDATFHVPVNPDYAFGLKVPIIGRRCFLVECDRSTMPVKRRNFDKTSIVRKMAGYIQGHSMKLHEQQFGWKAFRVLFVTTSAERAENMRSALAELSKAPNVRRLFYFTHTQALTGSDVLTHAWIDGNGEPVTLI